MKRLYISAVFIVITLFGAFFQTWYVGKKVDEFNDKIETIDELVRNNDFDKAYEIGSQVEKDWSKAVKNIDVLLIHDYVDSITVNMSKISACIECKNKDLYIIESAGIKKGLTSLKESEYPSFDNLM